MTTIVTENLSRVNKIQFLYTKNSIYIFNISFGVVA